MMSCFFQILLMVFTSTLPQGSWHHPLCTYSIHRPHPERGEIKKSDNKSLCQLKILHSNLMRREAVRGNVLMAVLYLPYCECSTRVYDWSNWTTGWLVGWGLSFVVVAEDTVYSSRWTVKEGDLFWVLMCLLFGSCYITISTWTANTKFIKRHRRKKQNFGLLSHDDEGIACYRCLR